MNSVVVMNEDKWRSSEFIGLVNGDQWTTPTFCSSEATSVRPLKVFGYLAYTHVSKMKASKLDLRALHGIFVGYDNASKAHKIYNL